MCVLYVSFGSKVRPRTFGCVDMGSALLFIPSFDVCICWLNLAASCLDDENEPPLKVIASFSVSRFSLP